MAMLYYIVSLLSQIYIDGPILRAVQESRIYNDSKHFVDMPLVHHPIETLRAFKQLGPRIRDQEVLRHFLSTHFREPGGELHGCFPTDWLANPPSISRIRDRSYRRWALDLHRLWKDLCRQVSEEVRESPELHSILYVPNPFIVPGGRFREFYYWDTYWILKGVLFSEMYQMAAGIIRNLAYMVDHHGFVPNGGRVYYLLRSQPPLLAPMVYDYYIATGDVDLVAELLPSLEREWQFWTTHRSASYSVRGVELFRYYQHKVAMKTPRPESYREDMELSVGLKKVEEKRMLWSNVASAAETGWDFSSRWFAQEGADANDMRSIRTTQIVPVDLNAFMCMNARLLWSFYEIAGNQTKAREYHSEFTQMKQEMLYMHWNETDGIWYDYDLGTEKHVNAFYLSNALPVFARCYDEELDPRRLHQYLSNSGALSFAKGLPTSFNHDSDQQWDSHNAWPPLVHMVIEGFRTSGDPEMYEVARDLATKWLKISHQSYTATSAMFEKYNASAQDEASSGRGGEYEVQTGFGWTNGVVLDLIGKFASYDEVEHGQMYVLPDFKGWARVILPFVILFYTGKYVRLYDN